MVRQLPGGGGSEAPLRGQRQVLSRSSFCFVALVILTAARASASRPATVYRQQHSHRGPRGGPSRQLIGFDIASWRTFRTVCLLPRRCRALGWQRGRCLLLFPRSADGYETGRRICSHRCRVCRRFLADRSAADVTIPSLPTQSSGTPSGSCPPDARREGFDLQAVAMGRTWRSRWPMAEAGEVEWRQERGCSVLFGWFGTVQQPVEQKKLEV